MGTRIKIKWSVKESGTETIDLDELGITDETWGSLTDQEKSAYVIDLLDEAEIELYPELESWTEIND